MGAEPAEVNREFFTEMDTKPRWSLMRAMGAMTLACVFFGFVSYFKPPGFMCVLLALALLAYVIDDKTPQKIILPFVVIVWLLCLVLALLRDFTEYVGRQ